MTTRKKFFLTKERIEMFRSIYPHASTSNIAEMFECSEHAIYNAAYRLGLKKDKEFIRKTQADRMKNPNHPARKYLFKKGCIPANKGKKQTNFMSKEAIERTKATRFTKGHIPKNHRPVGYERVSRKDGYISVKVAEPNKFRLKHHIVWEKHYGPIKKGENIQFKDGNPQNCNIDNLYLISRKEQMLENSGAINLPDSMIASYMAGSRSKRNPRLFEELKKHPELLELKRRQILLNREIRNGREK